MADRKRWYKKVGAAAVAGRECLVWLISNYVSDSSSDGLTDWMSLLHDSTRGCFDSFLVISLGVFTKLPSREIGGTKPLTRREISGASLPFFPQHIIRHVCSETKKSYLTSFCPDLSVFLRFCKVAFQS